MTSLILRRSAVVRFFILMAAVALLLFYVSTRRQEFEKRSIMEKGLEASVPAMGENVIVSEKGSGGVPQGNGQGEKSVDGKGEGLISGVSNGHERGLFEESRIERERTISRETELLKSVAEEPDADDVIKNEALARLMDLSRDEAGAKNAEELIRQAGYEDAFISPANGGAIVFIKTSTLEVSDVARIADIVMRCLGIGPEGISITPKT
jgi:hypothetical protein